MDLMQNQAHLDAVEDAHGWQHQQQVMTFLGCDCVDIVLEKGKSVRDKKKTRKLHAIGLSETTRGKKLDICVLMTSFRPCCCNI